MEQTSEKTGKSGFSLAKIAGHRAALSAAKIVLAAMVFFSFGGSTYAQLITPLLSDDTPPRLSNLGYYALRIDGEGYFVVRDPVTDVLCVTRSGWVFIDENNYVVADGVARLQGLVGPEMTNCGDLNLNPLLDYCLSSGAMISYLTFQSDGMLRVVFADGSTVMAGQVLLQQFTNPAALGTYPYKLKSINPAAGPLAVMRAPGSAGLGALAFGFEYPEPELKLKPINGSDSTNGACSLAETLIPSDLGIMGRGYFVVRDTNTSQLFATRAGTFLLDPDGYLINYAGHRLQGYTVGNAGDRGDINIASHPELGSIDDLLVFSIGMDGIILSHFNDGTRYQSGQVLLANFTSSELGGRTNFSCYPLINSSNVLAKLVAPGRTNTGWVVGGTVDSREMDDAIINVSRTLNYFRQGQIEPTQNETDLAIGGYGYFTLRNPTNDVRFATRDGRFHMDADGFVTHSSGYRLQGFSDPELSSVGDLRIDKQGAPAGVYPDAKVIMFFVAYDGKVLVPLNDGTTFVRCQVLLQKYRWGYGLRSAGGLLYSNLPAAVPMPNQRVPGSDGIGVIIRGNLEIPTAPVTRQNAAQNRILPYGFSESRPRDD